MTADDMPRDIGHVAFDDAGTGGESTTHRGDNRSRTGRWVQDMPSMERDAEACRLRARGWSLQRVSDDLGYGSKGNVHRAIQRAKEVTIRPAAQELVQHELDALDHLIDRAMEVLESRHLAVHGGKVVYVGADPVEGEDDTRSPLIDDSPTLQAIATLQRLYESRRKLLGTDAAVKVDATVHEVTQEDLAITDLINSAKARNAVEEQNLRAGR